MFSNGIKNRLLVQDGGKFKPSRILITVCAGFCILVIFGLQLFSSVGSMERSGPASVEPPRIDSTAPVKPPAVTSTKMAEKAERIKRQTHRLHSLTFQPLKAVHLGHKPEIPIGSQIEATLSSGSSNGIVTARLDSSLESDGEILLPKGTLLYGKGSSTDERLYITFSSAILSDRTRLKINAQAFDHKDLMEGLKGKKISDYAFKLATSAGLFFLSGLADGMREDTYSNPFAQRRPTVKDAALNGVSTATVETGKEMLQKMNEDKTRIEVKATTKIFVIFGDSENGH